jgi:hypothetical protein
MLSRLEGVAAPMFGCAECGAALLLEIESRGDRTELWWREPAVERHWYRPGNHLRSVET